jgi:putative PIN family toxin of toxin-antitoxin system
MWVPDTDVIVAAIRSRMGGAAEVVRSALRGDVPICLSVALVLEYESVVTRGEHLAASKLSTDDMILVLDTLVQIAKPVESHFRWRPQLRDANDEMVLEAAVNGGASAIITFNRKDFGSAASRFGILVLSPKQALETLR